MFAFHCWMLSIELCEDFYSFFLLRIVSLRLALLHIHGLAHPIPVQLFLRVSSRHQSLKFANTFLPTCQVFTALVTATMPPRSCTCLLKFQSSLSQKASQWPRPLRCRRSSVLKSTSLLHGLSRRQIMHPVFANRIWL